MKCRTNLKGLRSLKASRVMRGITQLDMPDHTGIPYSRYTRIENGYVSATDAELTTLARLFETTVADLFPERAAA